MKILIIDDEQQEKLKEMIVKLYPEYEYVRLEEISDSEDIFVHLFTKETIEINLDSQEDITIEDIYTWEADVSVHWFQFTVTEILDRLSKYHVLTYANTVGLFGIAHPVDFLYEQFKQLKI